MALSGQAAIICRDARGGLDCVHNMDVSMKKKTLFVLGLSALLVAVPIVFGAGIDSQMARSFVGQDLHLGGKLLLVHRQGSGEHSLVFSDGFSMSIGANQFSSDSAVVWLGSQTTEFRGRNYVSYKVQVYLEGDISVKKTNSAKTVDLSERVIEKGRAMVVGFGVSGEVFVTADKRELGDPDQLELYKKAWAAVSGVKIEPEIAVKEEAALPKLSAEKIKPAKQEASKEMIAARPEKPEAGEKAEAVEEKSAEPAEAVVSQEVKEPRFVYPVNIAPAGEEPLKMDSAPGEEGEDIATITERLYVWQKQDEKGGLLELQADNAVIFYGRGGFGLGEESGQGEGAEDILSKGAVRAIYMSGDIVMTEGSRSIRADELYYDFQRKKAVVVNAVMRNFDVSRGIPIYVRAAKLRQVAENQFAAEKVTVTSSEFYKPQISSTVSSVIITDTTTIDEQTGKVTDRSYDAQMHDVRVKMGDRTIFRWPFMRPGLERPDMPIKSVHAGYDSSWGPSLETRWYLSRLLGLREPEGTDSSFMLDYYGKRGVGSGVEIEYEKENSFGRLLGYTIYDSGKDTLGRDDSRRNIEPPRKLRGRFNWQHRQFLPYNWQVTTGIGYSSDENFIEEFYRSEFNTGNPLETYIHAKRSEDNWAVSFLGKARLNDFADELEELPSFEFHKTGQSLFDDKFTLYSDTELSRLRQRIGNDHSVLIDESDFTFASHRTELDMPIRADNFKIVPFVAGTVAYDDRSGFTRTLVDGSNSGVFGEDDVWMGEEGVRVGTQFWKVYPGVKSRLWDLNQLRHVVNPQLSAVIFEESADVVEQRNMLNMGISQRLQTKRGSADKQRTIDWMRLDTEVTLVDDPGDTSGGPDRYIWNKSFVPMRVFSSPDIFNGDLSSSLHRFEMFGVRRNYFAADYIWRVSDTLAVMSDTNFDIQSGVVQQFNFGFSRLCWPNLSYYIGNRYLRRVEVLDEKGSNAFVFSVTYVLDPRYTLVYSAQFDFDYGANIRSDVSLIRKYHRMYCGFTFSADQSLDRQAIVFSIWPQGIKELGIGQRKFMKLGDSAGY